MGVRKTLAYLVLAGLAVMMFCSQTAVAGPLKTDLKVYLEKVRGMYPEAEVTGSFSDWRSVSIYRSHAGMHLGYDIALNAGRAVPAGWAGRVVAIIPWTDTEFGVCVEVAGGFRVTYGHLHPIVSEGQIIQPGTLVGTVAHDHVDIKVKDASGGYLDWGATYGVLDGTGAWVAGGSGGLLPPPPGTGGPVISAPVGIEGLVENYRHQTLDAFLRKVERDRVQTLVDALSLYIDHESRGLPQAESQMLAWHRAADEHKVTEAQVEALELTVRARRTRVTRLSIILQGRQHDLAERRTAYETARTSADATRDAARKAGASEDRLSQIDSDARSTARKMAASETNKDLDLRVADAEQKYQFLKTRYAQSGVALTQVEEAERTLERLRVARALWLHGNRDEAWGLGF